MVAKRWTTAIPLGTPIVRQIVKTLD
ncbi:hypothetical protein DSUL_60204 [Desulfovibrionales bacterium]